MSKYITSIISILAVLLIFIQVSGASQFNECKDKVNELENKTEKLKENKSELKTEIEKLERDIDQYQQENIKLTKKVNNLKDKLEQKGKWNAKELMRNLGIYYVKNDGGLRYKLIYHFGGLGGVNIYQYVGPWKGDAGKWNQYKKIGFKREYEKGKGFEKPGMVLQPIWGFENGTTRVRSLYDIRQVEKKYNNIDGLSKYFEWVRESYQKSSQYNIAQVFFIFFISVAIGAVFGDVVRPLYKVKEHLTMRVMADFGERKISNTPFIVLAGICILIPIIVLASTGNIILSLITFLMFGIIAMGIYRLIKG